MWPESASKGDQMTGGGEAFELSADVMTVVSGANQAGVRAYNERLILSLVRRYRQLSKVEVARVTGLSVQSTSAIMNRLQADGLLRREAPMRGRVGQPTVPLSLDPEGAFSLGVKIGRRSCDLVLVDFDGKVRQRARETYAFPTPENVFDFMARRLPEFSRGLSRRQHQRVAGVGIATPFQLWNWDAETGAPPGALEVWRRVDIAAEAAKVCDWPATIFNDATSACAAEFFFGDAWRHRDFIYFFVGSFVGGGLVLDGALYPGRTGNAAAIGSMPLRPLNADDGRIVQLISAASIYQLERRLSVAGIDPSTIWRTPDAWGDIGGHLDAWIEEAAYALAYACAAAIAVIDVKAAIVDGAIPSNVRNWLVARVAHHFATLDQRGLSDLTIEAGSIGADARAIGAAALPLIKNFARDREVLFKDAPTGPA